jgi:hypothetical protein
MPERVQRKRTKGFKMPPNTIYVGRPTKFGNPFGWQAGLQEGYSEEQCKRLVVKFYKDWILGNEYFNPVVYGQPPKVEDIKKALKGKNLACWCKEGTPCHADVLIELANN